MKLYRALHTQALAGEATADATVKPEILISKPCATLLRFAQTKTRPQGFRAFWNIVKRSQLSYKLLAAGIVLDVAVS